MREEIIGDCRLILGDCQAVMPLLGRFDAVVTDPPYGIGLDRGFGGGGFGFFGGGEHGILKSHEKVALYMRSCGAKMKGASGLYMRRCAGQLLRQMQEGSRCRW